MLNPYNRDFQINLLAHIAKDPEFFRKVKSYIRLSDFELPSCQMVLETLLHYDKLVGGGSPDFMTLQTHIMFVMQQPETITNLLPEEYESLAYVMQVIANIDTNSMYYEAMLPKYLKHIRTNQQLALHASQVASGGDPDELIQRLYEANSDVGGNDDFFLDSVSMNPEPVMSLEDKIRIPMSLGRLNELTDRGLGLGEIGMVTACPGVGKTTSLINFMVSAMHANHRCLFLTLELSGKRIKHRYQSIAAHINAGWLKKPIPTWPIAEMQRYQFLHDPGNPYFDKIHITDLSKKSFKIEDINRAMGMWFEYVDKTYSDTEACRGVYVDWLDKIDPSGLNVSLKDSGDKVLVKIAEKLGELSRKYNVALWTATQGTRQADGVERLEMRHTAYGYHKNDPLDVSLGLGPVQQDARTAVAEAHRSSSAGAVIIDDDVADGESKLPPPCNRHLMFNLMKNRDNAAGALAFFQGSTLKYWDYEADATTAENTIREYGLRGLKEYKG